MDDIARAVLIAFDLILRRDPELVRIVLLSLRVSLTATVLAFCLAAPAGAALAVYAFRGRMVLLIVLNALLGLPPVVVGLVVYLLLSRSGPLGQLGLLFTPAAMILAQTVLALPIVAALSHRVAESLWLDYGDALRVDGASRSRAVTVLLAMGRAGLVTTFLAAFGRVIAEVGAIMIVGGNISGHTRTMTTAIVLETSKGNLPLALGLGLILVAISVVVSGLAFTLGRRREVVRTASLDRPQK
jgi:tungstate transport system permease protein